MYVCPWYGDQKTTLGVIPWVLYTLFDFYFISFHFMKQNLELNQSG